MVRFKLFKSNATNLRAYTAYDENQHLISDDHPLIVTREKEIEDIEYQKMFRKYKQVTINYKDHSKNKKPRICKERRIQKFFAL